MQAIARVNRVFRDKPGGLVVDYLGLADQLKQALAAFEADRGLGCVQAGLTIANSRQNWLTALFAIEYTALFDAIVPALSHHHLPVPLGGTSNHFPGIR